MPGSEDKDSQGWFVDPGVSPEELATAFTYKLNADPVSSGGYCLGTSGINMTKGDLVTGTGSSYPVYCE